MRDQQMEWVLALIGVPGWTKFVTIEHVIICEKYSKHSTNGEVDGEDYFGE